MADKTIYILGAGFSKAAGIPTQAELLSHALQQSPNLAKFVGDVYGLKGKAAGNLALEDVYTPIHRAISRNETLKGHSVVDLKNLENELTHNLSVSINVEIGAYDAEDRYLMKFVRMLIAGAPQYSNTVISLNWDILLDRALFLACPASDRTQIDYGTHCTGIENEDDRMMPGLLAKSRRLPVIPLLKLHGSLNWLICPQCDRLYINRFRKVALEIHLCRHCQPRQVQLERSIILPTFQKALGTFHYQHIWNQAAHELKEATKIVFIGYSFPLADFDFRTLITKHVSTRTQIEVVLHESDKTKTTGTGYYSYFGAKRCKVRYVGVEGYLSAPTFSP